MTDRRLLNIRITEDEADILSAYTEQMRQTQTEVLRAFIRSLEARLRRISPERVDPALLPSLPLTRRDAVPPVGAIYFFLKETGEILYVGEAANLALRCGYHHAREAALEMDQHARIHWLEKRSGRGAFEAACIKRFQPALNRAIGPKSKFC